MLLLTWRNLLARKVRLLMSTLAIVLGIGSVRQAACVRSAASSAASSTTASSP